MVPASGKWMAPVLLRSCFLAFVMALAVLVPAAAQEIYTVRGVPVDATADTPVAAREQAVRDGRRLAFDRLVARLVPSDQAAFVPPPPDEALGDLVVGFEVAGERSSAVRYLATMTFAFDPARVRALLNRDGVPFAEIRSLPVLVIPILNNGSRAVLWEEPNPFRAAWIDAPPASGLVPFLMPYGDLEDFRDLSTAQAVGGDVQALARIAERYGARDAVVVRATPRPAGAVEIAVQRIGPTGFDTTLIETVVPSVQPSPALGDAGLFRDAIQRTVTLIEDAWKRDNLMRQGLESRVTVTVPLDSLRRWLFVRRELERAVIVSRFDVVQLTRGEALVDLWINGDAEQLRVSLEQRNLRLIPGAGDYMLVQRGQPVPGPSVPRDDAPSPADPVPADPLSTAPLPGAPAPADTTTPAPGQRS
jgi:hypothetical protein